MKRQILYDSIYVKYLESSKIIETGDLPGGPVAKTLLPIQEVQM